LLFLVLTFLGTQLHKQRAQRKASSSFEDALNEPVYEEIDYLVTSTKEDLLPGSDDSVPKLPYYTGEDEDNSDYKSTPGSRGQSLDVWSDGYDDAEEVPVPEAPLASQMSEGNIPPEEKNGVRASQTGYSLQLLTGAADSGKGEDSPWLLKGEERDPGYDDVELSVPGTSIMTLP
uniref:Uncharacterized protein n=1 Tax=Loxodonta africana TaxID=9785 RepID=G3UAX6_LOXAF